MLLVMLLVMLMLMLMAVTRGSRERGRLFRLAGHGPGPAALRMTPTTPTTTSLVRRGT
jgi:hypothetical protein